MVPDELLEAGRPHLRAAGYSRESPATPVYNCFAWAAGQTMAWWEPAAPDIIPHLGPTFWPAGVPNELALDSFVQAFSTLGYEECETADLEPGHEKVALYVDADGDPSHAARQLRSGVWTSKIGELEDIEHPTLRAVEGPAYGRVARILKRPLEVRAS